MDTDNFRVGTRSPIKGHLGINYDVFMYLPHFITPPLQSFPIHHFTSIIPGRPGGPNLLTRSPARLLTAPTGFVIGGEFIGRSNSILV